MRLKIGEKEYSIKFAYKPTLKEHIVSKFVRYTNITNENGGIDIEKMEELLLFLPEAILVGLQVNYPEFKYDCDTGNGKEEKLEKVFELVEEYMRQNNADIIYLFNQLQETLMQDSFLKSLFQKEQKKSEKTEKMENLTVIETKKKEN